MRFPFAAQMAFALKSQPFEQRDRSAVLRIGVGKDASQLQLGKTIIDNARYRLARDPAAPMVVVQDIADFFDVGLAVDQDHPPDRDIVAAR